MTKQELLTHQPLIIAGPCSIGSREQIVQIAHQVEAAGAQAIRAQLWKPRTRPDSFQGIGEQGIPWIQEVKDTTNLIVCVEVTSPEQIGMIRDVADVLWVGARNMQNYELLKAIRDDGRPVILKRGLISTVKEWLGAAEYMGKDNVILCERGIRTGADSMRFTLDLNSMLVAQRDHHMPVIVDPSHTAGRRDMVPSLALAATAAGADGLVIEAHYNPEEEQVDRDQTITIESLIDVITKVKKISVIV